MKKYLFSIVLFLIILVSPAVAQQAKAATLTSSQINAIVGLLRSFGADESVISNVEISLNGNTSTAAPTCNVSFYPTSISTGGSSTVTWSSSSNASELSYVCSGPVNGSGAAALSGSNLFTFNSAGTETCTITVKNSAGQTGTCSASLGVSTQSLSVDLKVNGSDNPSTIPYGTTFTVSWTSAGASYCTGYGTDIVRADGGVWTNGSYPASGSQTLYAKSATGVTPFSAFQLGIQCWDSSGKSVTDSIEKIPVSSATITPTAVNGSCGSANGNTSSYSSAPSSNLCSAGTASSVTAGTNSYTWTCAGSNGGTSASCSANKTSSAVSCASTHYGCNNGLSYNNVSGTSSYTWTCTDSGFSPATSVSCSEAKTTSTTAPTCNVSFSPTSISTGGSSTVTWSSSSNASELSYVCSGPVNGSGAAALSGSNSYTFNSAGTETCTITVKNSAGQTGTCSASLGVSSSSTTSNATQMQNGQQYSSSASSGSPAKYYFTLDSDVNRVTVQITTDDWTENADLIVSSIAQPTCSDFRKDFGESGYYSNVIGDSNESVFIRPETHPSQSFSSGTKFYVTVCGTTSRTAMFRVFYNAYMAATASATSNKQIAGVFGAVEKLVLGGTASEQRSIFKHVWNRDLQIGSPYIEDIKALQTALAKESVYVGDITGGFYNQTFVGVKNFQKKYGIEQTGFVGPITRSKLNTIYSD